MLKTPNLRSFHHAEISKANRLELSDNYYDLESTHPYMGSKIFDEVQVLALNLFAQPRYQPTDQKDGHFE
jgi:hypothetical protein